MNVEQYKDIAPYRGGSDVRDAIERVLKNKDALYRILSSLGPVESEAERKQVDTFTRHIFSELEKVKTYDEFQEHITAGIFLPAIIEKSVNKFSFDGLQKKSRMTKLTCL